MYEYPYSDSTGNYCYKTLGGKRVKIYEHLGVAESMKLSGKFKDIHPIYSVKANIKTSENFQNTIDNKIQENVVQYTKDITDEFSDVLLQENIVWKTFVRSNNEVANSAYNINPNYFKNFEEAKKFIRDKMNNGEYAKCDDEIKYIVAHEVGHNISTGLYNQLNADTLRTVEKYEKWNNSFMTRVINRYKNEVSSEIDYVKEVSKYATSGKNKVELFAECFAEYTSSSTPRIFAKIFGEELEKERKTLK